MAMSMIAAIVGRLLLALFFVIMGLQKIVYPGTMTPMFTDTNLSPTFVIPVGIFELVAGVLLAVGLMTRVVSILLFAWTLLSIFFFYNQFTDPIEGPMALALASVAGGLLLAFAYGHLRGSYDYMRTRRRAHDAELRAAKAEGRAEGLERAQPTIVRD
jgi:putative oxidoreductase